MADVLIAKETAVVSVDGSPTRVLRNITRVSADSQLAKDHPELFKPASDGVSFPTRTARREPKLAEKKS
jgi:hypothetical protein